jgi:hypothetical protein
MNPDDFDPALLAFLRKCEPERSAEPQPDREPDREHEPTKCSCRPECTSAPAIAYLGRWYAIEHAPRDALQATHVPRVGETPRATAGMISPRLAIGICEDGRRAKGAHEGGFIDPPQAHPDASHQFPLILGSGVSAKVGYADTPAGARLERMLSADEEQRHSLCDALAAMSGTPIGLSPARIARERMRRG